MDMISKKLANDRLYAYHGGRFWVWDEGRSIWKESHLLAKKYDLNHEYDKLLTPEDFLSDPSQFQALEDYEVDYILKSALQNAQPCQNAPIDPVEETAVMPAQDTSPAATAEDKPTAFDYSGLDAQTVDALHMAENQYTQGKKMTETGLRWMVNAVAMAHDTLCGTVVQQLDNGKFAPKDDTFRAWCASISLSKSSAYNLLRVAERFGNIELDGKSILDVQPATLLYEAAKPSAPAEMVQKVTTGEITSSAEYRAALAQIKAEKDRANAAEAREEEAWNMVSKAQEEAQTAKNDLDVALVDLNGLTEQNARLNAEKEQAEARAHKAEDALKHQPIAGVVDEEEVDRRATEKAWGLADARNRELQEENDRLKKNSAQLERRMKAMTHRMDDLGQTDFETANHCPAAMLAIWNSCKGSYSRLTGEDLESTFLYICNTLNSIRQEAALLCRQPEGYDGGAA